MDILSSLVVAEKCLNGPPTRQRLLVARLALSVANQRHTFRDDELSALSAALGSLTRIPKLQERLDKATNCDFLYWHRVILPIYFNAVYESKNHLHRIKASLWIYLNTVLILVFGFVIFMERIVQSYCEVTLSIATLTTEAPFSSSTGRKISPLSQMMFLAQGRRLHNWTQVLLWAPT